MANVIDYTKPVRTHSGKKVRILATDVEGLASGDTIVGIVEGGAEIQTWQADGCFARDIPSGLDLEQCSYEAEWGEWGFVLTVVGSDTITQKTIKVRYNGSGVSNTPLFLSIEEKEGSNPRAFSGSFPEDSLVALAKSILLLFEADTPKDKMSPDGEVEKPTTAWRPLSELPLSNGVHSVLLRGAGFICSGRVFCSGGKVTRILFDVAGDMVFPNRSSQYFPMTWMELPL